MGRKGKRRGDGGGRALQDRNNIRMLIDETRAIVHFVVDNDEEILLGGVFRDVGVCVFLCGCHCSGCGGARAFGFVIRAGVSGGVSSIRRSSVSWPG